MNDYGEWTIGKVSEPGSPESDNGTVGIDYKNHTSKIEVHGDNNYFLAEFISQKLNEELIPIENPFKIGDHVRVKGQPVLGVISLVKGDMVTVKFADNFLVDGPRFKIGTNTMHWKEFEKIKINVEVVNAN